MGKRSNFERVPRDFYPTPIEAVYPLLEHLEEDFLLVTPGIRSSGQENDDQKRISTASEAISNGADYIVIGREISNEIDPSEKIRQILETV